MLIEQSKAKQSKDFCTILINFLELFFVRVVKVLCWFFHDQMINELCDKSKKKKKA